MHHSCSNSQSTQGDVNLKSFSISVGSREKSKKLEFQLGETDCGEELATTDLCKEFRDLEPQFIKQPFWSTLPFQDELKLQRTNNFVLKKVVC